MKSDPEAGNRRGWGDLSGELTSPSKTPRKKRKSVKARGKEETKRVDDGLWGFVFLFFWLSLFFFFLFPALCSLFLARSLSLSLSFTHTRSLSLTHTFSLSLSHSFSLSLSFSFYLSHTRSLSLVFSRSLSLSLVFSLSLPLRSQLKGEPAERAKKEISSGRRKRRDTPPLFLSRPPALSLSPGLFSSFSAYLQKTRPFLALIVRCAFCSCGASAQTEYCAHQSEAKRQRRRCE